MTWWTGPAPSEFEFPLLGSLVSRLQVRPALLGPRVVDGGGVQHRAEPHLRAGLIIQGL
jgi:hypothetical protein